MPNPTVRRLAVAVLAGGVAAALAASSAAGAKPVRGPAPTGPIDLPAGVACPFAIHGEVVENRQTETIFSSGKIAYTGLFVSKVVNVENEKSVTYTTPGPVRITFEGDVAHFTASGPVIVFFFPGDAGPGDTSVGRTILFQGHVHITVDPGTFGFSDASWTGRTTDICEVLA